MMIWLMHDVRILNAPHPGTTFSPCFAGGDIGSFLTARNALLEASDAGGEAGAKANLWGMII